MKSTKKKYLVLFGSCMFAIMMMLNVSTTINGTNFSIDGYTALISGSTNCHEGGTPNPCEAVCLIEETTPCTYMDCGSGGQLCMTYTN